MKKKLLFILCGLFTFTMIDAQSVQIDESMKSMSQGQQNSLTVTLEGISQKDAEKAWTDYVKDFKGGKTKKDKKSKEIFTDNTTIKDLSANTVDVYAITNESGEDVVLTVWFDLGGAYLNSADHAEAYAKGEGLLNSFSNQVIKAQIKDNLDDEEKSLKKLNGDLKDLTKDKKDLEDDIEKYKKKIAEAEKDLAQNASDQTAKKTEIATQEGVVEKVKTQLEKIKD